MRRKGGKVVRRTGKGRRLLHNSDDKKQLPRKNAYNPCGNRAGALPRALPTADTGLCFGKRRKARGIKGVGGADKNRRRAF